MRQQSMEGSSNIEMNGDITNAQCPVENPLFALSSRIISIIVPNPNTPDTPPTVFYIQESVLTERSDVFKLILSNDGVEKAEEKIYIKDSSPEMVARLLEFLYAGEYTPPAPEWCPAVEIPMHGKGFLGTTVVLLQPVEAPANRLFSAIGFREPPVLSSLKRDPGTLRNFSNHRCPLTWKMDKISKWKYCYGDEDFLALTLCHAQMYCLGDRYGVSDLRELALHLLEEVLTTKNDRTACEKMGHARECYKWEINEALVELACYVYNNTVSSRSLSKMDPLRELLISFMVPNFTGLLHYGSSWTETYRAKLDDLLVAGAGEIFLDATILMTLKREESSITDVNKLYCLNCKRYSLHGSLCQTFQNFIPGPQDSENETHGKSGMLLEWLLENSGNAAE